MNFIVIKIKMNLRNEKYDSFALLRNAHVNKAWGHILGSLYQMSKCQKKWIKRLLSVYFVSDIVITVYNLILDTTCIKIWGKKNLGYFFENRICQKNKIKKRIYLFTSSLKILHRILMEFKHDLSSTFWNIIYIFFYIESS